MADTVKACSVDGCERPARSLASGICSTHYARLARTGTLAPREKKIQPPCSWEGCCAAVRAKGMCNTHYERVRCDRVVPKFRSKTSVWEKIDCSGGPDACWPWIGATRKGGYGVKTVNNRNEAVHRLVWVETNGPIPDGLIVCHSCDNPPCCNPRHHFLGTHADNAADRDAKGRHTTDRGERHYFAKLTDDDIRTIFALRSDKWTLREIGDKFGMTEQNAWFILKRKAWKHVVI